MKMATDSTMPHNTSRSGEAVTRQMTWPFLMHIDSHGRVLHLPKIRMKIRQATRVRLPRRR
jgi:hypothetical protein